MLFEKTFGVLSVKDPLDELNKIVTVDPHPDAGEIERYIYFQLSNFVCTPIIMTVFMIVITTDVRVEI